MLFGAVPSPNTPMGFFGDSHLNTVSSGALAPALYTSAFSGQLASLYAKDYLGYYDWITTTSLYARASARRSRHVRRTTHTSNSILPRILVNSAQVLRAQCRSDALCMVRRSKSAKL